jgi:pullulanase/glycogen debranching enzyme
MSGKVSFGLNLKDLVVWLSWQSNLRAVSNVPRCIRRAKLRRASSRLARSQWRAILEYAIARAAQSVGWSRQARKKRSRTAWTRLSGASTITVDKIWTQLLSDYNAAQESFDAASDVLHAHLRMNTLPTSNEFLAEERARVQIIVAQARLCGDRPKN